jgi:hypothetical protein
MPGVFGSPSSREKWSRERGAEILNGLIRNRGSHINSLWGFQTRESPIVSGVLLRSVPFVGGIVQIMTETA